MNEVHEISTYKDIADAINKMTLEQQNQPVQFILPSTNDDEVQDMMSGIAISTVHLFGFNKCRSTYDNKHHGDDVVILLDHNLFDDNGVIAYSLTELTPVYGKNGPTKNED